MPDWLEVDPLFDRAIGAAVARETHLPETFGFSTIQSLESPNEGDPSRNRVPDPHRYEFVEIIGQGGIGTVWRARDRDLDREVAIKVLRREFEISSSAIERFISEARIAGRLQHAGIPPVYEIGTLPDRRIYLAMKLIQGQTLSAILRSQSIDEPLRQQFLQYFESICQTMAFAHANHVIHCDLKLNNIMVGQFGEVHVMDWGLARITAKLTLAGNKHEKTYPLRNVSLSQTVTPGIPGDATTEQFDSTSREMDERVDVYSLGRLFFELMTGTPFAGDKDSVNSFVQFDRVIENTSLRTLVRDCLSGDRSQRPATATYLVRTLHDYQVHVQARIREMELAQHTAQLKADERRNRRRLWSLFGLIGVIVVVAIIVFRYRQVSEQLQRDRELLQQVNQYLDEADVDLQSGRKLRAETSIRNAEGLAKVAPLFVQEKVRDRLSDVRFLEQLESIRFMQSRIQDLPFPSANSRISQVGMTFDRDAPQYYANAFREYGIELEKMTELDAVQAIRSKPIREAIVRALDNWAMNVSTEDERNRLNRIADSVEEPSHGLAMRIRKAIGREKHDVLLSLAHELTEQHAPEIHFAVGHALRKSDLLDAALRVLTGARRRWPRDFWINLELGTVEALIKPIDPARSKPWIESAYALSDGNADVYTYLGIAQAGANLYADSETSFRQALTLNPNLTGGELRLAYVLSAQKKYADALKVVDLSISTKPENAFAHFNRGAILQLQKGSGEEIEKSYRRAVTHDPQFAQAWNNLGNTLTVQRKYDEADKAFESAQTAKPGYALTMFNRAVLHDLQNHFDRAISLYREVLLSDEKYAEAYYNLAHDLAYQKGLFSEAITYLERGIRLLPESEPSRGKWTRLIDSCRKWSQSDRRLTELLMTSAEPATPLEATELAVIAAWPHRLDFKTAVRYFEFAFDRNPAIATDLVQGYRYFAAGCAARVMGDQSIRGRAREWLAADLAVREKQLASNDQAIKQEVKSKLCYWLSDPNLTRIRDKVYLEILDDTEKKQWVEFWNKVRDLQK